MMKDVSCVRAAYVRACVCVHVVCVFVPLNV